jgi:hypothetical protein
MVARHRVVTVSTTALISSVCGAPAKALGQILDAHDQEDAKRVALALLGTELPDGATVTIDSAPLICFLEDRPRHAARYFPVFEAAMRGDIRIVISTITLAEVVAGRCARGARFWPLNIAVTDDRIPGRLDPRIS